MLLYLNSEKKLPIGAVIEIPALITLFQEEMMATEDKIIQKTPNSKTYKIIIDEPIHDPLVQAQNKHTYLPYDNGLYPSVQHEYGVKYDEFMRTISDIYQSKEIFCLIDVMEMVKDMGFNAVWTMERYKRVLITINSIDGLIIQEVK